MFALSKTRTIMPLALLAAIAMTCLQGAAFAADDTLPTRTVEVSAAGLNLADPADLARLDSRIERAARASCWTAEYRGLAGLAGREMCQKSAIASASGKRGLLVARAQSDQLAASAVQPAGTPAGTAQ